MPANPVNTAVEITQQQYDYAAELFARINKMSDQITFGNLSERRLLMSQRSALINQRQALLGVNGEQYVAIKRFANAYGRNWKSVLRCAWATGNYPMMVGRELKNMPALLQQIRNNRGLQWLDMFRLPPEETR